MHHAGMQHVREPDIGRPFLSRGHLRRNDGILIGLADDLVFADWLHRRIAGNRQSDDIGKLPFHRNRQLELLAFDELTVRHTLAVSGDDSVLH